MNNDFTNSNADTTAECASAATTRRRGPRPVDVRDGYINQFRSQLTITLRSHRAPAGDIDDIVQREVVNILMRFDALVAKYPDPKMYAQRRAKHAAVDYRRRMGAQCGTGADVRRDDDLKVVKGRQVFSGDNAYITDAFQVGTTYKGGGTLFDYYAYLDGHHQTAESNTDRMMLEAALLQVTERQRRLITLVVCYGYNVTQAAEYLGVARETASRGLSDALRTLKRVLDDQQAA